MRIENCGLLRIYSEIVNPRSAITMKALLALESGRTFSGVSFGAEGETVGEIVFNTSMAGYQEILTDPSYEGQIITMTSPQIGNYGVNEEDAESRKPFGAGLIVREISGLYSNWRARESLQAYLQRYGLVGLTDVDTRALTRHLRRGHANTTANLTRESPPARAVGAAPRPALARPRGRPRA